MTFRAIYGATRTGRWFSSQLEVRAAADPWDPDTDDPVEDADQFVSDEVYSVFIGTRGIFNGEPIALGDTAREYIYGSRLRSIMINGFESSLYDQPMPDRYLIFSIEELSTIKRPETRKGSGESG